MPSSPDPIVAGAAQRWQPTELGGITLVQASEQVAEKLALFELHTASGVPPMLLEPARKAAEAAGYAAGWAIGTRAAQHEAEERNRDARERAERDLAADRARIATAIDALRTAAHTASAVAAPVLSEIEELIVRSAFDIAEAVVGRTLRDDTTRGADAVARALALAPSGAPVLVSVSPLDHTVLREHDFGPDVTLVADPSLAPGDALANSGATVVDARISTGLERVRALLGGAR